MVSSFRRNPLTYGIFKIRNNIIFLDSSIQGEKLEEKEGGETVVVINQDGNGNEENYQEIAEEEMQVIQAEQSAILPLALGLTVAISILVMVACRVHVMRKSLQDKRYKYMKMDEEDYLINGMYL